MSGHSDVHPPPGRLLVSLRLLARLASLVGLGFVLARLATDRPNPLQPPDADLLLSFYYPALVTLGLVLAWRWALPGAVLALCGAAAFYGTTLALDGVWRRDWVFAGCAGAALLFVAEGYLARNRRRAAAPAQSGPGLPEQSD